MAEPLRYGEPHWESRPTQYVNSDITQRPSSNKSYEELRFDRLVANGSVDTRHFIPSSMRRHSDITSFRDRDILPVKVSEGKRLASFKIHENVLKSSEILKGAMEHNLEVKCACMVLFPELDPDIFECYVKWLYTHSLNASDNGLLIKMYKLGEGVRDDDFQESCLKALKGSFIPFTVEQILDILNNMFEDDGLYKYCLSEVGRGIISGKYNFDRDQLNDLEDHMINFMRTVMDTVRERSVFPEAPADSNIYKQHTQIPATPFGSQAQHPVGIQPTHYTPNIGWHFGGSAARTHLPKGGLFDTYKPANTTSTSSTDAHFDRGQPSASRLFGTGPAPITAQPVAVGRHYEAVPSVPTAQPSSRSLFGWSRGTSYPHQQTAEHPLTGFPKGRGYAGPAAGFDKPSKLTAAAPPAPLSSSDRVSQQPSLFGGKSSTTWDNPDPPSGARRPGLFDITTSGPTIKTPQAPTAELRSRHLFVSSIARTANSAPDAAQSSDVTTGFRPSSSRNKQATASLGKATAVPIRHHTKTPLELWLGKEIPVKASKISPSHRFYSEIMAQQKDGGDVGNVAGEAAPTSTLADVIQQKASFVANLKGKERASEWEDQNDTSCGESIVYTPGSSAASSQSDDAVAKELLNEETGTYSADTQQKEAVDNIPRSSTVDQLWPQMSDHSRHDYQVQLMILEQQNKRRLMLARSEAESNKTDAIVEAEKAKPQTANVPQNAGGIGASKKAYDWSGNAVFMDVQARQAAAGFGRYADSRASGFAQAADRYVGEGHKKGASFGDGSSFATRPSVTGGCEPSPVGVSVPMRPKFGFPTPLSAPAAIAAAQKSGETKPAMTYDN